MRIKDRKEFTTKSTPLSFAPTVKVRTALNAMVKSNYGSVVVVNKDKTIAGIVTERDLMNKLLYNKMDADKTALSDIMTLEVRVASANDNLLDWLRIMSNERFRHLPIVDEEGKLVSMMSQGDFVSYTWPELLTRLKETTKATIGVGYQIFMIVGAMLAYAILVKLLT